MNQPPAGGIDHEQVIANVRYVEELVSQHLELQATAHSIHVHEQQVSVEVTGSHYEARAWRAAIGGRIFPAHVDIHGVRRQLVLTRRVAVNVVEPPVYAQRYVVHSVPGSYIETGGRWAIYDGHGSNEVTYGESLDRELLVALAAEMNFQAAREARIA